MSAGNTGVATPFPWFGGKAKAAEAVWARLGNPDVYYEPFAGSLAVLLRRPVLKGKEFIGDSDAFVANFWRALANDPEGVRQHVRWPMIEADFHARAAWLSEEGARTAEAIREDPVWFDSQIAGWWAWVVSASLHPTRWPTIGDHPRGLSSQRPDEEWNERFDHLAARVRKLNVRISWQSAVRDQPKNALKAAFIDPPYKLTSRETRLYRAEVHDALHDEVEAWCLARAEDPNWRIVCAGFDGDFILDGWEVITWGTDARERLWVSPHCLPVDTALF